MTILLYNCSAEEERVLYFSPGGGDENKRSKGGAEKRACLRGKSVKRGRAVIINNATPPPRSLQVIARININIYNICVCDVYLCPIFTTPFYTIIWFPCNTYLYIVHPQSPRQSRESAYIDSAPGGIAIETDLSSSSAKNKVYLGIIIVSRGRNDIIYIMMNNYVL